MTEKPKAAAEKAQVSEILVAEAAIKTQTLLNNFDPQKSPPFVPLLDGSEVLSLTRNFTGGFAINYFVPFEMEDGELVYSSIVDRTASTLSFEAVFPRVLFFVAHVADKKKPAQKPRQ